MKILMIILACTVFVVSERASADSGGTISYLVAVDDEGSSVAAGFKFNSVASMAYRHQLEPTTDIERSKGLYLRLTAPIHNTYQPYVIAGYARFKHRGDHVDKGQLGFGLDYKLNSNISIYSEFIELVGDTNRLSLGARLQF